MQISGVSPWACWQWARLSLYTQGVIPRNSAAGFRGFATARRTGAALAMVGAVLAATPAPRAALATIGQTAQITAIPARPLPRYRVFSYIHPARPSPPHRPGEELLLSMQGSAIRLTLTLRQLQAMPAVRYRVRHPQLAQSYTYEGVTLRDLAVLGGFVGKDLRVYASNGFVSTILAQDYLNHPIMLAYAADGRPIPVLQKGPLTVVLPATTERFKSRSYSSAWVWFAERITPVP